MADNVRVDYLFKGVRRVTAKLSCKSDGTGETLVRKIALADLIFSDGQPPDALVIEQVTYENNGFSSVELLLDRPGGPIPVMRLGESSTGTLDFRRDGGLQDPAKALGGNGDLLLTSYGATEGSTYEILLEMRQKRL